MFNCSYNHIVLERVPQKSCEFLHGALSWLNTSPSTALTFFSSVRYCWVYDRRCRFEQHSPTKTTDTSFCWENRQISSLSSHSPDATL